MANTLRSFGLAISVALAPVPPLTATLPAAARAADVGNASLAPVIAKLLPTVVSVYVRTPVDKNTGDKGPAIFASAASQGSGFIIDPSGYIVTNRHVIEGAYRSRWC